MADPPKSCACPLCGAHASFMRLASDSFYGVSNYAAPLYGCGGCGSRFQHPVPARSVIAGFYPQGYWQETEHLGLMARLQSRYVALMLALDPMAWIRRLRLPQGARVLDVGCSRGDWLALIAAAGARVEGLEADPRAAAYARKHHQIAVTEADGDTWSPDPESYELVSFFHLLEHLREPFAFLDKVQRALVPEGRLLLRVPNVASWQARLLGAAWKGWEMPRHLTMFTPRALRAMLDARGFEVERLSTWSLRDGPPCLASSLLPSGEPTWQQIKGRPSAVRTLLYLGLTWLAAPFEGLASLCGRGAMITLIARKR